MLHLGLTWKPSHKLFNHCAKTYLYFTWTFWSLINFAWNIRLCSRTTVACWSTSHDGWAPKRNLTQNRTCIKDICTGTIIFVTSMRFPVLANWPCAVFPIQKLQETWCVKITSYTTFLGIAGISFPGSKLNFYILCHLKILGLTKTAILKVKLSGCRYIFGHKSLVKSVAWQDSQASNSNHLSVLFFNVLAKSSILCY